MKVENQWDGIESRNKSSHIWLTNAEPRANATHQ
jgi:hypothetical protein